MMNFQHLKTHFQHHLSSSIHVRNLSNSFFNLIPLLFHAIPEFILYDSIINSPSADQSSHEYGITKSKSGDLFSAQLLTLSYCIIKVCLCPTVWNTVRSRATYQKQDNQDYLFHKPSFSLLLISPPIAFCSFYKSQYAVHTSINLYSPPHLGIRDNKDFGRFYILHPCILFSFSFLYSFKHPLDRFLCMTESYLCINLRSLYALVTHLLLNRP